jgi:hypothetical protein
MHGSIIERRLKRILDQLSSADELSGNVTVSRSSTAGMAECLPVEREDDCVEVVQFQDVGWEAWSNWDKYD